MNNYFSLTKTFLGSVGMSEGQDKKRKRFIAFLAALVVLLVLLPACIAVCIYTSTLTSMLMHAENYTECYAMGVEMMYHIICIFTIVFGITVVTNVFYFSSDIQFLLPWPLRASKIVASKFTACVLIETVMQVLLVASCTIGYYFSVQPYPIEMVYAIPCILTLSILPMAYCGIITILVMGLTRFIRNKDVMQRITVGLLAVLLLLFVGSIGRLRGVDMLAYAEAMISGDTSIFRTLDCIFPNVYFFTRLVATGKPIYLLWYVLVNIGVIVLLLIVAELLYFKGILRLLSGTNKKESSSLDILMDKPRMHTPFTACFLKEIRILLRTPTFFTHCILANFIWPIFAFAAWKLQPNPVTLSSISENYANGSLKTRMLFLLGIVVLSMVVGAMNSISASAFSREGKHFSFMKYIPVPYHIQWESKLWIGVLFPLLAVLIFFVPFCILVHIPFISVLLYCIISFFSILLVAQIGLLIDSNQPKLIWDDELNALRENYNNFFAMAVAILLAAVFGFGGYWLLSKKLLSFSMCGILITALLFLLNLLVYMSIRHKISINIATQEEA